LTWLKPGQAEPVLGDSDPQGKCAAGQPLAIKAGIDRLGLLGDLVNRIVLSSLHQRRSCANTRASAPALLRDCCPRGLEYYERRRSHLADHRLNNDRRHPSEFHIECVGSTWREIEDASASVWTPVVDFAERWSGCRRAPKPAVDFRSRT
jgi:hypothetical protein